MPHLYLAPLQGVTPSEFCEDFDADENRMIGLPYGEKNYDNMLSRFHLIPESHGRTDRIAISGSRVSVLIKGYTKLHKII